MKTIFYVLPVLLFGCFIVMSGLTGFRFISRAEEAGRFGRPFMVKEARRSALISGLYVVLAGASLAILGLVPDTGADGLTVMGCFGLGALFIGFFVARGNYLRAKQAFELAQKLSQRK